MRIFIQALLPIGDTLFATPAIHALRQHYPDARITALVYPTNSGILASNPDIDDLVYWPARAQWLNPRVVRRLFSRLRRARFDLAVEFSNYAGWLSRLSGIPRRTEMRLPSLWWIRPGAGREWRRHHAVEHYADAVRRLGVPVLDMRLRIFPTEVEETRAEAWLESHGVEPDGLLVGIHPGGEGLWGRKKWSPAGFARVAGGLYDRLGARVVFMGGKDDAPLAAEIARRTHAPVIDVTGQTSLGETAALIRRCTVFLGNDSSPLHIATAVGTPAVGIYGVTDPRSYGPWVPGGERGVDYDIVRSNHPCACRFPLAGGITLPTWIPILLCPALEHITPAQVLEAVLAVAHANLPARNNPAPLQSREPEPAAT
ncbi:MAG TPA: glycosyltransferase family 9 protein [Chloroflexia bacterium]|nr:glycosyltransferase family 9 protein [Chloroflexia bacterium]